MLSSRNLKTADLPENEIYHEKELLLRIAEGDEQAFTALFRKYTFSLGSLAMKVLRDESAREDVLQEVFIKLWLNRDQLPEIQVLPAWLKKVTLNESLQHLRKTAVSKKHAIVLQTTGYTENTALQALGYKELRDRVNHFVQQMPEQRRKIYEINRLEGLSAREIALRMDLSYGHVRNVLSEAVKSIRDHIGAELFSLLLLVAGANWPC